jgi:hypothetical protein
MNNHNTNKIQHLQGMLGVAASMLQEFVDAEIFLVDIDTDDGEEISKLFADARKFIGKYNAERIASLPLENKLQITQAATADERAALRRLIAAAKRDTGQSKRCADFLLAWWNAQTCGGFDLTDLWAVDKAVADDMLTVIGLIARRHGEYPHDPAFDGNFRALVRDWRPELCSE